MSRQSRNARFAYRRKSNRILQRIIAKHRHEPGFIGATTALRIAGVTTGPGAVFLRWSHPA